VKEKSVYGAKRKGVCDCGGPKDVRYKRCRSCFSNSKLGSKTITEHGYILVRVRKDHHLADCRGLAYEHRLVLEKKLRRRLQDHELVHHIDGNRRNNEPQNLEVMTRSDHIAHHRPEKHRVIKLIY
jgi:hypothetical protein